MPWYPRKPRTVDAINTVRRRVLGTLTIRLRLYPDFDRGFPLYMRMFVSKEISIGTRLGRFILYSQRGSHLRPRHVKLRTSMNPGSSAARARRAARRAARYPGCRPVPLPRRLRARTHGRRL